MINLPEMNQSNVIFFTDEKNESSLKVGNLISDNVYRKSSLLNNNQVTVKVIKSVDNSTIASSIEDRTTSNESSLKNTEHPLLSKADYGFESTIDDSITVENVKIFEDFMYNKNYIQLIDEFKNSYPVDSWIQNGWFQDDYMKLINPYWLTFPPTADYVHYIMATFYVCVMISGIFGNALVIFMFIKCRSLRTPANTLVINLAFSDFVMLTEAPIFIYNSIYSGPALGSFACTVYGFIGGLTGTVSIMTLASISIDRYYVIVYPLEPIRRTTNARAKICVVICWIYGAIFSSLPLFDIGIGHYIPEGLLTSCSFDYLSPEPRVKTFILVYFFAAWVLPFIIIVYCYVNILKAVIETQKLGKDPKKTGSISSRHCKDQEKYRTEVKLAGVVVIVIFVWFVAWTPYAVVALLGISGQHQMITPMSSMLPAIFCKVASCIDPFVYAITHPRFRTELRTLSRSFRHQRRDTERQWISNAAQPSQISARVVEKREIAISSENDVEEVMIMVDFPPASVKNSPLKRGIGLSTVTPIEGSHLKNDAIDVCLSDKEAFKPPSWFVEPKFEDKPSNFKRLSKKIRAGSLKKESENK